MTNIERRAFLKKMRIASVLFFLPGFTLAAPPEGRGNKKKNKKAKQNEPFHNHGSDDVSGLIMAGISVTTARELFRNSGGKFGSYKPLPPGIRKNLARGKPIPPGIARTRLSGDYIGRLPRHYGYHWVGAGADLLLVQATSGLIADVLVDVFR